MGYKVFFENNKPVKAVRVSSIIDVDKFVEFGDDRERTEIRSLFIEAENEEDAMTITDKVVRNIWGKVLGLDPE